MIFPQKNRGFIELLGLAALAIASLALGIYSVHSANSRLQTLNNQVQSVTENVKNNPTLGASLPGGVAVFETSLQSAITTTATSMTLTANSVSGGSTLSGFNCFTLDEGSAQQEFVCGTVSGTTVSGMTRGVDPVTATSTTAALEFAHRRGTNVKITDFPLIQILKHQANGVETYPNILNYVYDKNFSQASTSAIITLGQLNRTAFGSATVGVTSGGTGATTLPSGGILVGNGTSAITSTSSPTGAYFTATSSTATSGFYGNVAVTGNTTLTGQLVASSTNNTLASSTMYTLNAGAINATSSIKINGVNVLTTGSTGAISTSTTFSMSTAQDSTATKTVQCVSPKVVAGGGYSGITETSSLGMTFELVTQNYPSATDSWTVTTKCSAVANSGSTCSGGTATVYAICVNP